DRARLDRANRRWDIAVPSHEHDRHVVALRDPLLQLQAIDIGELDVQKQASRQVGLRKGYVFGSRTECDRVHLQTRQQLGHCLADPAIIIDDEDDVVLWHTAMVHPDLPPVSLGSYSEHARDLLRQRLGLRRTVAIRSQLLRSRLSKLVTRSFDVRAKLRHSMLLRN